MKLAARSLAHRLHLPSPVSDDELLKQAEWRSAALSQDSDPADILEVSDDSSDDAASDAGSEH